VTLGFDSEAAWLNWCRNDDAMAAGTVLAGADMLDIAYGLEAVEDQNPPAETLWRLARSNLEDVANGLPSTFSVDTVLQPVCLVAELAMKAGLVWNGADETNFGKKGGEGHDLARLAERLRAESPHRDDAFIAGIVAHMPPYVKSRYSPAGLTRLQVVRLALGAQFIAASTLRRAGNVDHSFGLEQQPWPGPRRSLFEPV
jgi:hypothetical protein